ncbi:Pectinesterase inhibitor 12 [Cardamine amara subsp. amara]|uniref:Pectinesterase inhibitor 12 n=1 Tax=Cardamine amara subsp. amara TaxID=228776 RepID=A0ABD1B4R8_CARAN
MKFFILFVISSLLLNSFATAQTLIQDSCKKAAASDPNLKYDFCVQSLEQDPQSKSAKNLVDLLIASTKTAAAKNTNVVGTAQQILKTGKLDKPTEESLRDCVQLFNDAIDDYNKTLGDVTSRDYSSANVHLSAALDASSTCDDGFKEIKKQNPISNESYVLYHKILIPLAFTNMVK